MNRKLFIKTVVLWVVLVIFAIFNGSIRTFGYKPFVGDLVAHQISTVIFIGLIFLATWIGWRKEIASLPDKILLLIGLIWLVLTELFEFIAGHYLFGNTWERLLADYNIFNGRVWILVLLATLFMPIVVNRIIRRKQHLPNNN